MCFPFSLPGLEDYQGEVLHSVDYHSGARFRGKKVLLVGFGNSANDVICELTGNRHHNFVQFSERSERLFVMTGDLWEEGADTTALIRSPVSLVPRSLWMFIETLSYRAHWLRRLVAENVVGARSEIEPWRECFSVNPVEATQEVPAILTTIITTFF